MSKEVSLIFSHKIEYYLFKPIIKRFISNKLNVKIYTSNTLRPIILKDFDFGISFYEKKYKFWIILLKIFHRIVLILFTPHSFSSQYKRMMLKVFIKRRNISSILYRLSYITPKSRNINKLIYKIF